MSQLNVGLTWRYVDRMGLAMETPDGAWRVEVYRTPKTRTWWYLLIHGDNVVEDLSIASVERLLAEAGYDLADLVEVAPPGNRGVA